MKHIIDFLLNTIGNWGYFGIFFLMALESSFFPFPSEVVMIPAGYLSSKGEMNIFFAFVMGLFGSLAGAYLNYFLAFKFGSKFLSFIVKDEKMDKLNSFFEKHGEISTFNGRLIPGIRQYISFPAGLARMNMIMFTIYTGLGAGIWTAVLLGIGFFIGENENLWREKLHKATAIALIFVVVSSVIYFCIKKKKVCSGGK